MTGDRAPDAASGSLLSRRRVLLVVAAGLVPWVVVPYETGASLVFSFGLVTPPSLALESVVRYVAVDTVALPPRLLAWPVASLLYALAVASTALALVGREDRRVTAGLFGLAGLDVLYFALTFSTLRLRVLALPLGVVVLFLAAWESRPDAWGLRLDG
ncbi:TIGR04206 family protein [Halobacteriales archaeon QH_10_67_22]|nr:MAG: TIGR04206 family protein [Halobacteriales archaeon QH_10_67_22]